MSDMFEMAKGVVRCYAKDRGGRRLIETAPREVADCLLEGVKSTIVILRGGPFSDQARSDWADGLQNLVNIAEKEV